jgi:hypothetical protein
MPKFVSRANCQSQPAEAEIRSKRVVHFLIGQNRLLIGTADQFEPVIEQICRPTCPTLIAGRRLVKF